jgi:hypothetical protein
VKQLSSEYGMMLMEAYSTYDDRFSYIMGTHIQNRNWTAGIEGEGSVLSTELRGQWIKGGDLLMPLHEYKSEIGGYGIPVRDSHYVDMGT